MIGINHSLPKKGGKEKRTEKLFAVKGHILHMSIKQVKSTCTCQSKNDKEETGMMRGKGQETRKGERKETEREKRRCGKGKRGAEGG